MTPAGVQHRTTPPRQESGQTWAVPLSDLRVDDEIADALDAAVRSGWWSMGPRVERFETAFANFVGARHALAVSNGTAALHLALLAVGCGPGDEVVLPSLNFVAAANAVSNTGATPVFCDIVGPDDLNLDVADLAKTITPATKAIIVLHYGGHAAPMSAIMNVAREHGIVVIEDAAHAPGAMSGGARCGTIGAVGCFSFFSNKNLPTGEGGMVVTNDDTMAERLRLLRSHGMTTLTWDRHRGHAHSYDVVVAGFNYRMDELHAAIGLVQLGRLESANAARARMAVEYRGRLHGRAGITTPFADRIGDAESSHHLAVAVLPADVDRDEVRRSLAAVGVQTSVHYPPIHRFSHYRDAASSLPATDDVASRLLTLPLYPHMTSADGTLVTDALLQAVEA
jgi:dTDP-4-amino-4,6-dideoxygalactose transaminase